MKKIIFIIVGILINHSIIFSQIDEIIDDLQSNETYRNLGAVMEILDRNISEAFPYLRDLYDSKPIYVQTYFLEALYRFNDPDIRDKANNLLNRLDNLNQDESIFIDDPLLEKVDITRILVGCGQYNTINYVFDLINRDGTENINSSAYNLLESIIYRIPANEPQAKNILMNIALSNPDEDRRSITLGILSRKYGAEIINTLRDRFIHDTSIPVRFTALEYLLILDKVNFKALLITQIQSDPGWTFRVEMVDSLLKVYGLPSDLKYVIDYQPSEPNTTAKSLMEYSINNFIPPRPNKSTRDYLQRYLIDDIITPLIGYEWIRPSISYDYGGAVQNLLGIMNSGIDPTHFDFESFCSLLKTEIIPQIDKDYENSDLSIEGYKFLHYSFVYLLDQFNQEFNQECLYEAEK